ncbi:Signal recognition particle 54 kDa protein 3 [Prunus yedoensis var. nudiflora]|uniref:Signal recognition particle 54 kDa protein 3 n=1 Tax=Prunus yedoensis var. nudiflora TaxID=2094558 RepID=A0A314Y9K2_PRUYE|nr:Signal recognition particle 54 kDa protein 3 [Prunus yedoensis var. nudiflora]
MLDPGKPSFPPKKGKPSVVMFSGLQGSGKTTTRTKYAYYHQKKCLETCPSVCRYISSCAFDQLKQNATVFKIPFYGRGSERRRKNHSFRLGRVRKNNGGH